jgi:hypothetical protein
MRQLVAFSTLAAVACGGAGASGRITGKVTIDGSAGANAVIEALGSTAATAVSGDDGTFSLEGLKDGHYLVRATVDGAEEPPQTAPVHVERGAGDQQPAFTFHLAAGVVSGKVVFSDGSNPSGLGVVLAGPLARTVLTDAMGAFSFSGLPSGAYLLSIDAPDTRERQQAVTFTLMNGSPALTLPDLQFTATATLKGTVKDSAMMPASGVEVTVPGTAARSLTDAAGGFELTDVPAGMRSVVATLGGALPQSAKDDLTVTRGLNAPMMLTLSAAGLPTGTVTGGVTFFHSGLANVITVSALGSGASVTASAEGSYTLDVPVGEWDVVAEAPIYPRKLLGHVTVKAGTTLTLPPAHMSIWRRFPEELNLTSSPVPADWRHSESDWFLMQTIANGNAEDWVANIKTLSRRLFHYGAVPVTTPILSRTGQYLAYQVSNGVYVVNLVTGAQTAFARAASLSHDFSTDESTYFHPDAPGLMRYTLATGTRKDFPGTSTLKLSRDRWLVMNGLTQEVTLVTPTTDAVVFTAVSSVNIMPIPYAYTGCVAGACTIKLLPAGSSNAVTMQGGPYNPTSTSFPFGGALESTADFAVFNSGVGLKLVKVADGSAVDLPTNTSRVDFNEAGTRLFYLSGGPGAMSLREEAVPPTGSVAPQVTVTAANPPVEWLSPSRLVLFDDATGAARRIEVKLGVATPDTDYVASSGGLRPPLAHWARSSDMKRAAVVADSTVHVLDIPGSSVVSFAAGFEGVELPGRWGVISDTAVTSFKGTYVIDGVKDEVRNLSQLRVTGGPTTAHSWSATHAFSSEVGYLTFAADEFWAPAEPGITPGPGIPRPTGMWLLSVEPTAAMRASAVVADVPYP